MQPRRTGTQSLKNPVDYMLAKLGGRTRAWSCAAHACVIVLLFVAGCADSQSSSSAESSPQAAVNRGPGLAANGETAEHAARRLFPQARRLALRYAETPSAHRLIEDSQQGAVVPLSEVYDTPYRDLVSWTLPNDSQAVSGDMFRAMRPSAMRKDMFLVPMLSGGRVVCVYWVGLDDSGLWATELWNGRYVRDLREATEKLREVLGPGTKVRPAMFLPHGLAFAVGDNDGREAAVCLGGVAQGEGIEGFGGELPDIGRLLTRAELKRLLN